VPAKFDLTFAATESGDDIWLIVEYCTALFRKEKIVRLAGHLRNLLNAIVEDANIQLGELDILSDAERHQLGRIDQQDLSKAPTIAGLSEYISGEKISALENKGISLLRTGKKTDKNFFLVHSGSGHSIEYLKFTSNLNENFNYWGINYERGNYYGPRERTIEEIASDYIKKIKGIQASGPYYISGWSLGGTIVFEIAWQMEQNGDKIKFLGIYDTMPLEKGLRLPSSFEEKKFTLRTEYELIERILPEYRLPEKHKVRSVMDLWDHIMGDLTKISNDLAIKERLYNNYFGGLRINMQDYMRLTLAEILENLNLRRELLSSDLRYEEKGEINTPINYFIADKEKQVYEKAWSNYSSETVRFYHIDADHFSMFDEDAEKLAGAVERALEEENI
jgi:surfactin family lipopeptide synthetase A/fengycin family lipopeptide synthetase D